MNFFEQAPSHDWAPLKYRGATIAEVWLKPDGEPLALTFRIPRNSFQIVDLDQRLTPANLLKALGISREEVASWHHDGASDSGAQGSTDLGQRLPPPADNVAHLHVAVRLTPPGQEVAGAECTEPEITPAKWQDLDARWKAILALEGGVESMRLSMESLRLEMEAASKKPLTTEEKEHALRADIAHWDKEKKRVHYALPKAREFIHRATWAVGSPERKKLEELYKNHIQPQVPFPEMGKALELLENLQKDRQILSAQGMSVYQDCKRIAADVQGALRTLQANAKANVIKKRGATRKKG
jgi:hypothetical protein